MWPIYDARPHLILFICLQLHDYIIQYDQSYSWIWLFNAIMVFITWFIIVWAVQMNYQWKGIYVIEKVGKYAKTAIEWVSWIHHEVFISFKSIIFYLKINMEDRLLHNFLLAENNTKQDKHNDNWKEPFFFLAVIYSISHRKFPCISHYLPQNSSIGMGTLHVRHQNGIIKGTRSYCHRGNLIVLIMCISILIPNLFDHISYLTCNGKCKWLHFIPVLAVWI